MPFETDLTKLSQTDSTDTASVWILVLSAANIPHTIESRDGTFLLQVPPDMHLRADYELASYYDENKNWPPQKPPPDDFTPLFKPFALILMTVMALFYMKTGPWSEQSLWFVKGAGRSTAILDLNQYHLLVTPLTLHADMVHLAGNCVIGFFLLHLLFKMTGNGLGILTTLLTAILGNYINVLVHGNNHVFVGFSTAVFAAIGIQTALQMQQLNTVGFKGLRLLLPFMAGMGLLALFGTAGERTDLGAHLFGLLGGIIGGYILALNLSKLRSSTSVQIFSALLSFVIIVFSWYLSFSTSTPLN